MKSAFGLASTKCNILKQQPGMFFVLASRCHGNLRWYPLHIENHTRLRWLQAAGYSSSWLRVLAAQPCPCCKVFHPHTRINLGKQHPFFCATDVSCTHVASVLSRGWKACHLSRSCRKTLYHITSPRMCQECVGKHPASVPA